MNTDNEFEKSWLGDEQPPAASPAQALTEARQAQEAQTASEFAQAFEADDQKKDAQ
jgi:hypothetical protein